MEIVIGLLCFWIFFICYMIYRNRWVSKEQIKILYKVSNDCGKEIVLCSEEKISGIKREWPEPKEYFETHLGKYYDYNKMLYTFWIWDVEKMRYY